MEGMPFTAHAANGSSGSQGARKNRYANKRSPGHTRAVLNVLSLLRTPERGEV